MVDFVEAIKRPFTDIKALIIGAVLALLGVFTLGILMLPVMGYGLRTAKNTLNNNPALPKWDKWGDLFVKGIVALIVSIVYMLPALIVIGLGIAGTIASIQTAALAGMVTPEAIMQLIMPALAANALIFLVGILLALIAAFLLPMALVLYVKEESFGAAFRVGEVIRKVLTGKYIVAWIVVVVYSAIVSSILGFVPLIGSAVAMFMVTVTEYTVFAQAYRELSGAAPSAPRA